MSKNRFIKYYYSKLKIPNSRFTNNQSSIFSDESENDCRSSSDNLESLMGNGFSLIELLVVISITSLMMAILLPSLNTARKQAQAVFCLNNLRQFVIAAHIYTDSYNGKYPLAYYTGKIGNTRYYFAWDFTTHKDWSTSPPTGVVEPGLLWDGNTTEEIHQCPSFKGSANWFADPYTGYNYNTSYIGHGACESIPEPARITDVKSPSTCALFGDGEYGSGANKFMRAPWPNPGDANFSGRWAEGHRDTVI